MILTPAAQINVPSLAILRPGSDQPFWADPARARDAAEPDNGDGDPGASAATFGAAIDGWRRKCGIPRPSSAARACVSAATACRPLLDHGDWGSKRLAVVTASTTSAAATAVKFEMRGLTEGWNAVDPLLLPSTLLSALPTQVAMAVRAHGFAFTCGTGLLGAFHAVECAIHGLCRGDADIALVVGSEELTPVQHLGYEVLGWGPAPGEFAGVITLERATRRGYRVEFVAYGSDPAAPPLPLGWDAVPQYRLAAPRPQTAMQNGAAVRLICSALLGRHERVAVSGYVPGLGSASVGFARV